MKDLSRCIGEINNIVKEIIICFKGIDYDL